MSNYLRKTIRILCLGFCLYLLIKVLGPMLIKTTFWERDFALYWSTGRLNTTGENPYSPEQNLKLQKQYGLVSEDIEVIAALRYQLWMMPLVTGFGLFDYPTSRVLWLLFTIAVLLISFEIIWAIYQGRHREHWLASIIGFTFMPVLYAIGPGQITPLALLGIAVFLKYIQNPRHPYLVGASLAFASAKPHVICLFFIAIALWVFKTRSWKILLGSFLAVLLATPTFGGFLRVQLGADLAWLQFLPSVIGILWLAGYWIKNANSWNWLRATPLLLSVFVVTTPFMWTYDQVVLAMLGLIFLAAIEEQKTTWPVLVAGGLYVLINLSTLFLHRIYDNYCVFEAGSRLTDLVPVSESF